MFPGAFSLRIACISRLRVHYLPSVSPRGCLEFTDLMSCCRVEQYTSVRMRDAIAVNLDPRSTFLNADGGPYSCRSPKTA